MKNNLVNMIETKLLPAAVQLCTHFSCDDYWDQISRSNVGCIGMLSFVLPLFTNTVTPDSSSDTPLILI